MSETIFQGLDDFEICPETFFQGLCDLKTYFPEIFREYDGSGVFCFNSSAPLQLEIFDLFTWLSARRSQLLVEGQLIHDHVIIRFNGTTLLQESGLINPSWSGDVIDQSGDNIENMVYTVGVSDDAKTSLKQPCIANNFGGDLQGGLPNEFIEVESEVDTAEIDTNSVGSLQTTRGKGKVTISKTELEKQFGKSLDDAAKALGASRSKVKRNLRLHGYKQWPKSRRDIPVKVKAKYGDKSDNKFIQFELFESSRMDELQKQVTKRLKKSYTVHYPNNENELILLGCDDDLQNHISSSKTLGNEYFNISLEPV